MADHESDRDRVRELGTRRPQGQTPTDVGRTMGGGSLGHAPADDVVAEADLRNNPPGESPDADRLRQNHAAGDRGRATGAERDPVTSEDDATRKTNI